MRISLQGIGWDARQGQGATRYTEDIATDN